MRLLSLSVASSLFWLQLLFLPTNAQSSTTVIDILSQNVEFSYFVRLLQKHEMIPILNQMGNITLAAPVNSAFASYFCSNELTTSSQCLDKSINSMKKQDIYSYIVESPIASTDFEGYRMFNSVVDDDALDPHSSPVLVHIDSNKSIFTLNEVDVIEPDLYANIQESYVQGIDRLFDLYPLDVVLRDQVTTNHSAISSFLSTYEESLDNVTVFLPTDESIQLKDYEISYLFSEFGAGDRKLLTNSFVVDGYLGGILNATYTDRNGYPLHLTADSEGKSLIINDTIKSFSKPQISSNAVLHLYNDSSLVPIIEFNPMKVLIGLGANAFVKELILQDLASMITNNSLEQTIFYAKDAGQYSIESKSSNLYHFVDERIEDLSSAKSLYNTRFCNSKKLGGSCQKLKIESVGENTFMLNNNVLIEDGPFKVGNTVIYLTDDNVRTPSELVSSVNPVFHCTKSLNLLSDLKLTKFSNNGLGYTVFLPCYDSYRDFDLTLEYLKNNKTLMDKVLKNFILEGLVYTDIEEETLLNNLNMDSVLVHGMSYRKNGDMKLKLNNDTLLLKKNDDILFNQGVIHPVNKLMIPEDIDISLGNIVESAIRKDNLFKDYLEKFEGISNILLNSSDYSILLPSKLKVPLFDSDADIEKFLKVHLIPKQSLHELHQCLNDIEIQTLDPKVNLTCTRVSNNNVFLSIKGGTENGVTIFARGCTNNNDNSCVYLIDKPINLKWLDDNSHYHISLPGIALGVGIILGSLLMILILSCLMLVILQKRKSTINDDDGDEESSTLIANADAEINTYASTLNESNFETGYSENTNVSPIHFPQKNGQPTTNKRVQN